MKTLTKEGVIAIAKDPEPIKFREMFEAEFDRHHNIIIRPNIFWEGYEDEDEQQEYCIDSEFVKAHFSQFVDDDNNWHCSHRNYLINEHLNDRDIMDAAIELCQHMEPCEAVVFTTTPESANPEWKNGLCGWMKELN